MIEFGECDASGHREIILLSRLEDAPEGTLIQWYIDGQPFGGPMLPGTHVGKVPGDGEIHYIELHIVGYEGGADAERVKFPSCSRGTVEADIRRILFADECDEEGNRAVQLVPQIAPAEAAENVIVQWYIDGRPVGHPGPPEPLMDKVPGDGKVHLAELRVLEPNNGRGDTEQFEVPTCDGQAVEVKIRSVDFADCDSEGNRPLRVTPVLEPAGTDGVVVQWYIGGQPVGQPGTPAPLMTAVAGDGQVRNIEVRVLEPSTGVGDSENIEIPVCERVSVSIGEIDFADCDDDGNRPLRLVPRVSGPSADEVTVQWYLDGQPLGPPRHAQPHVATAPGDGNVHNVELRVISPNGIDSDFAEVEIPECHSLGAVEIVGVDISGVCNDDGTRTLTLTSAYTMYDKPGGVKWYLDGQDISGSTASGEYTVDLPGLGNQHTLTLEGIDPPFGAVSKSIEIASCEPVPRVVNIAGIDFGACQDDGSVVVTLESVVTPSGAPVQVQWSVDGQLVGAPHSPGQTTITMQGDGEHHLFEVRVVSETGWSWGAEHFLVPSCSPVTDDPPDDDDPDKPVIVPPGGSTNTDTEDTDDEDEDKKPKVEIVSVDIAEECNDELTRAVTLTSSVPGHPNATVRWLLDEEEIIAPGKAGTVEIDLRGTGEEQTLKLEAVNPSEAGTDTQAIDIPVCQVHVDQSDLIYLQAAGSDGSDDTVPGAHLRWQLTGELGLNHLPHGDVGAAPDLVSLVRYPYEPVPIEVQSGNFVSGVAEVLGEGGVRRVLLQNNGGVQHLSVENEAFFAVQLQLAGTAQVEVVSRRLIEHKKRKATTEGLEVTTTFETEDLVIFRDTASGSFRAEVDNGSFVRLKGATATAIKFETYSDLYASQRAQEVELGQYGLTLDTVEVRRRLATPSESAIETWPKYGDAGIRVANYMKRWDDAGDGLGLKTAVDDYVRLSPTDPHAKVTHDSDLDGDLHQLEFSLLDALNLNALDYHIARMLGLGAIDDAPASTSDRFIYCVKYTPPGEAEQTYFTMPTGVDDYRLPDPLTLKPPTYGVTAPSSTGGLQLTDDDGYSKWTERRYVNLFAEPLSAGPRIENFFESSDTIDSGSFSDLVLMGVEYRKSAESAWRRPIDPSDESNTTGGLDGDPEFRDGDGHPEPIPLLPPLDLKSRRAKDVNAFHPKLNTPILTHIEREPGKHDYAAYSINWFSRRSPLSAPVSTDVTDFPHNCFIAPPAPLAAHLIQEEHPLMMTSQVEQANRLDQLRITFGWGPAQYKADPEADTVSFKWRSEPVRIVSGEIKRVSDSGCAEDECLIETTSLQMASTGNPDEKLVPVIAPFEVGEYVGSHLTTDSGVFKIIEITTSGNGLHPTIKAKQQRTAVQDISIGPNAGIGESFKPPKVGELFSISENLNAPGNSQWTDLGATVQLVQPEGLTDSAAVISNTDPIKGDPLAPGIWAVRLPSVSLPATGSPDVEWAGGSLSCTLADGEESTLTVLRIATVGSGLFAVVQSSEPLNLSTQEVTLYPGYRAYFEISALAINKSDLVPAAPDTLRTTYLSGYSSNSTQGCSSDVAVPTQINAIRVTTPLPPKQPAGSMWATPPDPHFGRATYTFDAEFETSDGGEARTPYGFIVERATLRSVLSTLYTEDSVEDILELHRKPTSSDFWANRWQNLVNVPDGATAFESFDGVALQTPNNPESPFVQPDATNTSSPPKFNGSTFDPDMIRDALEQAFVPITEAPLLMQFVEDGDQTSSDAPVLTDRSGRPLSPLDPAYSPSPMVRKLPGNGFKVRFTDYTLDGAANRDVFFYRVREISETQALSEPSAPVGPVRLINTKPPKPPTIVRSYVRPGTEIENARQAAKDYAAAIRMAEANGDPRPERPEPAPVDENDPEFEKPAVVFELAPFLEDEEISHVRLYRAFNQEDAESTQTMEPASDIELVNVPILGSEIPLAVDEFNDLKFNPSGMQVWYRLAALRRQETEAPEATAVLSAALGPIAFEIPDISPPKIVLSRVRAARGPDRQTIQSVEVLSTVCRPNINVAAQFLSSTGRWRDAASDSSNFECEVELAWVTPSFVPGADSAGAELPPMRLIATSGSDRSTISLIERSDIDYVDGLSA